MIEADPARLREELTQVAAVAVAMLERLPLTDGRGPMHRSAASKLCLRSPFRVVRNEPRAIAGRQSGDRRVTLHYEGGSPRCSDLAQGEVAVLMVCLGPEDGPVFTFGRLATVEISIPPAVPFFLRENK